MATRLLIAPRAAALACAVMTGVIACAGVLACGDLPRDPSATSMVTTTVALDDAIPISAVTEVGSAPILAMSASGHRATAWVSAPDGGTDGRLHVSVAAPDGTEMPATEIRDPLGPIEPHGEAPPKLAWARDTNGHETLGALYVVGKLVPGRRFPASSLRFVRSDDRGRTWSDPVTVTDDSTGARALDRDFGSYNFHALHAAPNGQLHAAWLDGRHGASAVYATHSSDGGRTWSPNVRVVPATSVAAEACPCCRTAIAADAKGTVYLAWRAVLPADNPDGMQSARVPHPRDPSPVSAHDAHGAGHSPTSASNPTREAVRDLVVARSTDGGVTWGAPVRIHADGWLFDGCPHAGPSLALDDTGTLHAAWWTGKTGGAGVYYAQSRDGARTFEAPVPLGVAEQSRPAHVQLAVASRTGTAPLIVTTWDDGTRRTPQVVLRASFDGGATFGDAVAVSEPTVSAGFPVLGLRSSNTGADVLVAWSQQSPQAAADAAAARPDMRDPNARMPLPSVGNTQVLVRTGRVVVSTAAKAVHEDGAFRALQVGDMAPPYAVEVIAGDAVGDTLHIGERSTGRTTQLTLLNVWATWCTSCREEMADLNALHTEYAARGLRVIGVSVDRASQARVLGFSAKEQLLFAVAHDPANGIGELYGVVGVPETWLIDDAGRVRWKVTGNVHGALVEARAAIEAALHETDESPMS